MSFVKIVPFVLIEKKDEEEVVETFNKAIDGLVVRRIPVFDSGIDTIAVKQVENAEEVLKEVHDSFEED